MEIKISSDAEKILRKFNKTETVEKDVSKLVKDTLHNIERDAKLNLTKNDSVKSGRLRGSIISAYSGEVGTDVEYAEYVEYGTRYQNAKPYFEPAVEKNLEKFDEELDKIVDKLLDDIF